MSKWEDTVMTNDMRINRLLFGIIMSVAVLLASGKIVYKFVPMTPQTTATATVR